MRFKALLTRILPSVGKNAILTELDQIKNSFETCTYPVTIKSMESLKKERSLSPEYLDIERSFNTVVRGKKMSPTFVAVCDNIKDLLTYLEEAVETKFNDDVTRSALSAYVTNILQLIQCVGFTSDYMRRLCVYLVNCQIVYNRSSEDPAGTKAELMYLEQNKQAFFNCLAVFTLPVNDIKNKLEKLADVILNGDNFDQVRSSLGYGKVDPLQLNFISPRYSPAMFIGTMIVKYQVAKYKQAQADLQEIQCKILYLKSLRDGKEDAKLEKQIEYYTNLNNRTKAEIDEMEKEYGLNDD